MGLASYELLRLESYNIQMRTIIAGSRSLGFKAVSEAMEFCGWIPSVVISGCARGVDQAGEAWAKQHTIPIERYPADWSLGKSAGYIRNSKMAEAADALIAVWDGQSRGTHHMIDIACNQGLKVYVHTPNA